MYYNNISGTLKIHLCLSHIGQVSRLPGPVSPNVLYNASLQITLKVSEVSCTDVFNLPFLFNSSSISKMQS